MIALRDDRLEFRFPEVHAKARCSISFMRTLRLPDDNRSHPLPPGLGHFPLHHVDDFGVTVPPAWRRHGGVFLPMYQAEAMWIDFNGSYPMALKIAAGKVCALTGEAWSSELVVEPQGYLVVPEQPWLDGFCVAEGLIRQFVAMPLGEGYSAEEQLTGEARHGGLQIEAHPMKPDVYEALHRAPEPEHFAMYSSMPAQAPDMGLAPGGLMRQEVYEDEYGLEAWDLSHSSRCFVHIVNSVQYLEVTGERPPSMLRPPRTTPGPVCLGSSTTTATWLCCQGRPAWRALTVSRPRRSKREKANWETTGRSSPKGSSSCRTVRCGKESSEGLVHKHERQGRLGLEHRRK